MLARVDEGRALGMSRHQAEAALLIAGERRGRPHRVTAVLGGGPRRAPGTTRPRGGRDRGRPAPSRRPNLGGSRRAAGPAVALIASMIGAETKKDLVIDLCSRGATPSVSSALESLTAVFGMGTGVASPLGSPGSFFERDDVTWQAV